MTKTRSVMIYDGECSFCRRWISRWKHVTGDQVEYLASQEAVERFPQFSVADYERSIQWIDLEGDVFEGAEAVFSALACAPDKTWPLWIYRNVPGFAPVAEWGYRIVAKNRGVL